MDESLYVCPGDTIQYVCSISPPVNSISWMVQCAPPGRPCGIDGMQTHPTALQNEPKNLTVCGNVWSIFVSELENLTSQARSNVTFHIPHSPQASKLCLQCQSVWNSTLRVAGIYLGCMRVIIIGEAESVM